MGAVAAVKRHWSLLWAARFVARWEGWLPTAYLDTIAQPPVDTQGYGHTRYAGPPIPPDGTWSKAKGLRILARDCRSSAAAVDRLVEHKLTVRQRMALISFVFNLGPNILPGTDLLAALNRGNFHSAARLMLQYDHGGHGEVVEGLLRRRRAEAWLMTHPRKKPPVPRRHGDHPHTKAHRRS
jgi:lysozyme